MYRKFQEAFQVLAPGTFTVYEEGGNQKLKIVDEKILSEAIEFQIIYVFTPVSSQYKDKFPEIEILQTKYNELQKDFIDVTEILKKINITGDTLKMFYVLPELNENEVWVRTKNGFRGFDIGNLEANIKALIEEFKKLVTESFEEFEKEKDKAIEEVKDEGDKQEQRLNDLSNNIDDKLELIWRMYAVITGTNRYLSGNDISNRDISKLERDVNGGDITSRTGNPSFIYNGGDIANRAILVPKTIDLGGVNG